LEAADEVLLFYSRGMASPGLKGCEVL